MLKAPPAGGRHINVRNRCRVTSTSERCWVCSGQMCFCWLLPQITWPGTKSSDEVGGSRFHLPACLASVAGKVRHVPTEMFQAPQYLTGTRACVSSLRARALHMAASGCMWLLQEICMCSNLMRGQDSNAPNPDTYSRRGTGLNGLHWGDMQSARSPLREQA